VVVHAGALMNSNNLRISTVAGKAAAVVEAEEEQGQPGGKPTTPPCAIPNARREHHDFLGVGQRRHSDTSSLAHFQQDAGSNRAQLLRTRSERVRSGYAQEPFASESFLPSVVCNDGADEKQGAAPEGCGLRRSSTIENGLSGLAEEDESDDDNLDKNEPTNRVMQPFRQGALMKRCRMDYHTPVFCSPHSISSSVSSVPSQKYAQNNESISGTPELRPEFQPVRSSRGKTVESKLAAALRAVTPEPKQRRKKAHHVVPSSSVAMAGMADLILHKSKNIFAEITLDDHEQAQSFALQRRKEVQRKWENVPLMCT
jgi:hypothetical protein